MNLEWAERIRELRKTLGLTQEEFAELLDISKDYVRQLETGRYEVILCWQRIIQFIHDCTSNALGILRQKPWLEGNMAGRVQGILEALDWTQDQLAVFLGIRGERVSEWINYQEPMQACYGILLALLEIYSGVDRKQWPPSLYFEPEDSIGRERIRLLRLSLCMTQSQFGNVLHVSRNTVTNLETGGRSPGWCTNLLLRVIETYPKAVDLFGQIPWGDERVSPGKARHVRESIGLTQLELAHFLGASLTVIKSYENEIEGVKEPGCPTLVYLLLEKYPDEFTYFVEGLSSPGGQACPIW